MNSKVGNIESNGITFHNNQENNENINNKQ